MSVISKKGKHAIGIFVDGYDLKYVCLRKLKNRIQLLGVKTLRLPSKLEDAKISPTLDDDIRFDSMDTGSFDLDSGYVNQTDSLVNNETVIRDLLADFQGINYKLAYSVTEPAIDYQIIETNFGLKGKKLTERVSEELGNIRSSSPEPDALSVLETGTGSTICIVREDGVHLANLISNALVSAGKRPPRIPLIDAAEIALMNSVRMNYRFESDEHTLIIYVAQEFTRLIYMRGNEYQHFAPVIAEDLESSNLQQTIYSRASLEQHNIGIHHLDRIIFAGDAHRLQLDLFLKDKFTVSDVGYMQYENLDTSLLENTGVEELSEYAIPIATAWKLLDSKNTAFYPCNLIPSHLVSEQNIFKLAWHGYALLILLFLVTVLFATQIPMQERTIRQLEQEAKFKETQVHEVHSLETSVAHVQNEITKLQSALNLYDQLVPGYNRWSRNLNHLSTGIEDLNSLWILDVKSIGEQGKGLEINGYSIYRSRIPRFANLFDNAVLQEVLVQEIRGRTVYRFKIIIENSEV